MKVLRGIRGHSESSREMEEDEPMKKTEWIQRQESNCEGREAHQPKERQVTSNTAYGEQDAPGCNNYQAGHWGPLRTVFNRTGPGCRLKRIEKKLGEQMETRRDFPVKNCGYQAKGLCWPFSTLKFT